MVGNKSIHTIFVTFIFHLMCSYNRVKKEKSSLTIQGKLCSSCQIVSNICSIKDNACPVMIIAISCGEEKRKQQCMLSVLFNLFTVKIIC